MKSYNRVRGEMVRVATELIVLLSEERRSLKSLASAVGKSEKTIRRYIDAMESAGLPIERETISIRGEPSYHTEFRLMPDWVERRKWLK